MLRVLKPLDEVLDEPRPLDHGPGLPTTAHVPASTPILGRHELRLVIAVPQGVTSTSVGGASKQEEARLRELGTREELVSDQGREELGVTQRGAVTEGAQELRGREVLEAEGRREEVAREGEGRGGGLPRMEEACVVIEVSKDQIFGFHLQMMGLKQ